MRRQAERKAEAMAALARHPYRPPWWGRSRHLQTCFGSFARKPFQRRLPYRHERWETPDDDFLDVHFLDGDPDKPWVLLLHGLEGRLRSFYMTGYAETFERLGWNVAVLIFRTCGREMNRAPRTYHMGECTDLAFVVEELNARIGGAPLFLLGVSLGGNVLGKWLGEVGDGAPSNLRGAAVVSPPFDPSISAPAFHRILFGLYSMRFMRTLVPKGLAKARQFPGLLDEAAIRACRDFNSFDTVVTARLHGFRDARAYWEHVGCGQYLGGIRVPTLLIASADDPFNEGVTLPREAAEASDWLHPLFTERGGHVGFISAGGGSWAEAQAGRFFEAYAAD